MIATIPTLGQSDLLWPLLELLQDDDTISQVWVYDNGIADPIAFMVLEQFLSAKIQYCDGFGLSIYQMWNRAIERAVPLGENLAILNDDISLQTPVLALLDHFLSAIPNLWLVSPDPLTFELGVCTPRFVTGTYREGGVCGFCFAVRAAVCPRIDEAYEIWYGDDDLVAKIQAAGGRCAKIVGLPVFHQESTTLNQQPWTIQARERDTQRWLAIGQP